MIGPVVISEPNAGIRAVLDGLARETGSIEPAGNPQELYETSRRMAEHGHVTEAIAPAVQAAKLMPSNSRYLGHLGQLCHDDHRVVVASRLLREALRLDPDSIECHFRLANHLLDTGNGAGARDHYERAIALSQGSSSKAISAILLERYASCLTALGDTARAISVYALLRQNPRTRATALFELALTGGAAPQPDVESEIRAELGRSELRPEDRAKLLLGLGRIEDRAGNTDAAFACWTASRALLKSGYDRAHDERYTRGVLSVYSQGTLRAVAGQGCASQVPVFVVGLARSGTTLTERILAAHPDAAGVGELRDLATRHSRFMASFQANGQADDLRQSVNASRFRTAGEEHLSMLAFMAGRKARIVQKYPLNYIALGYIHMVFPQAKIVHCRRHPADCFLSAFQNDMNATHGYCFDQVDFAYRYRNYETLMRHWSSQFGDTIFDLQYEDLVDRPEATARRLLDFVGLPWDDQVLSFHAKASTVNTPSRGQVRQPLYRSSVGRWRRYDRHLTPLLSILAAART